MENQNETEPTTTDTQTRAPRLTEDRTTAVLQLYFAQPGESAQGFTFQGSHKAPPTDEEPYARTQAVGELWGSLDYGWLDGKVGAVVIKNLAGENKGEITKSTPEEAAAVREQVIEVSFGEQAGLIIPPGCFVAFVPDRPSNVRLRSRSGKPKVRLVVLPGSGGAA
jgi:hypothetical protein